MSIYQKYFNEKTGDKGELLSFELEYPDNFNFAYDVIDVYAKEEPEKRAVVWCDMEGDSKPSLFRISVSLVTKLPMFSWRPELRRATV